MPSVMPGGHQFSQVPRATIERSQFDRSHGVKTTFDAGWLVPIYVDEALPGDTFNLQLHAFARLATPLKPLMDNLYLESFFFAVPNRLVWKNWKRFCGEQNNPGDSTSFVIPQVVAGGSGFGRDGLMDHFGIPPTVASLSVSALPIRAYNLIYHEWFRDQNLQSATFVFGSSDGDGPDSPPGTGAGMYRRGKRHDYFTSCLPWPQKGTAVSLPLGTSAPVIPDGANVYPTFKTATGPYTGQFEATSAANPTAVRWTGSGVPGAGDDFRWDDPNLMADLSTATAATINQLRQAFQIQKLLERDARGGTRYTEIVKSHFGVTSPDARLQRPEYLGGGSTPIVVSPVAQNSSTDATTPQGNLAGIGTVSLSGHGFAKSFTEHCVIIGLVCVRADLTYQQGLERMWSRSSRYDYYWPALAHIGEQSVLNKEIYCDGSGNDNLTFGYQERYAEYRYKPSQISCQFRSTHTTPLDIWHLSQEFGALPTLNATFIVEDPPVDRVIAVDTEPHFLFDGFVKLTCARPMPMYSVPGLIDHF